MGQFERSCDSVICKMHDFSMTTHGRRSSQATFCVSRTRRFKILCQAACGMLAIWWGPEFAFSTLSSQGGPLHVDFSTGFDKPVNFGTCDVAAEMATLAKRAIGSDVAANVLHGEAYGGLTCVRGLLGEAILKQMRSEVNMLRTTLKTSECWNGWQGGRGDKYRLLDLQSMELGGYCGLACGIGLFFAVCRELQQKQSLGEAALRPTSHVQLARFPGDATRYLAHTDSSPFEDLDDDMPLDQRQMIASRRVTAILYLNELPWESSYGGALRAHQSGKPAHDVMPDGGSLVLFRSRDLEHEVLPAYHDRLALTMWYTSEQDLEK